MGSNMHCAFIEPTVVELYYYYDTIEKMAHRHVLVLAKTKWFQLALSLAQSL